MSSIPVADPGLTAAPAPGSADYEVSLESLNQWQLAWRRFRRHRLALIGLGIFGFMVFLAIFGPIIWPWDPLAFQACSSPKCFSPLEMPPMGSDNAGRSVWVLVANGARLSMLIGISTMVIAVTIGVLVGSAAGYFGGWVDGVSMRFVDLMLSIPFLFIVLVAARYFGAGEILPMILIFGFLSWLGLARLVRALYLSLREQEFVQAAKAVGVGDFRIALRHILPNAMGPIVVSASLLVASAIILEAFVCVPELRPEELRHQLGQRPRQEPVDDGQRQLVVAVLPRDGDRPDGHRDQLHRRRTSRRSRPTGPGVSL